MSSRGESTARSSSRRSGSGRTTDGKRRSTSPGTKTIRKRNPRAAEIRAHEDTRLAEAPLAIGLRRNEVVHASEKLFARRLARIAIERPEDSRQALADQLAALDPAAQEREGRVEKLGPGALCWEGSEVGGEGIDQLGEVAEQAKVALLVEVESLAALPLRSETRSPLVEPRDDARLDGASVPTRRADLALLAEKVLERHLRGGEELHDEGAVEVDIEQSEQQAQGARGCVDSGDALEEIGVDAGALEGGGEVRGVGARLAEEHRDVLEAHAIVGGAEDLPRDLDRLERLTGSREDVQRAIERLRRCRKRGEDVALCAGERGGRRRCRRSSYGCRTGRQVLVAPLTEARSCRRAVSQHVPDWVVPWNCLEKRCKRRRRVVDVADDDGAEVGHGERSCSGRVNVRAVEYA